jgi:hypothetical protein
MAEDNKKGCAGCAPDEVFIAPYGTEPPAQMASAQVTREALAASRWRVQSIAKALDSLPPGLTDADFKAAMPPLESRLRGEYPGAAGGTDFTTPEPPPEATFQAPTKPPRHTTQARHYTLADITDTKPTTHMQLQSGPNGMEVVQVNSTSQPHHHQFQRAPRERPRRQCRCIKAELDKSFGLNDKGWQWQTGEGEETVLRDNRGNKDRGAQRRSLDVAGNNYPSLTPHVYFSASVLLTVRNPDPEADVATAIVRCRVWPQNITDFGRRARGVDDEILDDHYGWADDNVSQEALRRWMDEYCHPRNSCVLGRKPGPDNEEEDEETQEEGPLTKRQFVEILTSWSVQRGRGGPGDFIFFEHRQKLKCTEGPHRITVRIPLLPISIDTSEGEGNKRAAYDHAKYLADLIIRCGRHDITLIDSTNKFVSGMYKLNIYDSTRGREDD